MATTTERAALVLDLFDSYYERVYAFLRKSTTNDVAEDLAQEVFLRLLQHPDLERLTISISYLLKIAHNLLRRRYARATRLRELLEERAMTSEGANPTASTARRSHADELSPDILETALGLLGRDEQDAIRLIVCEGKSYQHAAEALGVSVTTINNWKHRGIVKLRGLVEADEAAAERRAMADVEVTTTRARPASRRHLRGEATERATTAASGVRQSPSRNGGTASSMVQRSLLEWRASQDEVA